MISRTVPAPKQSKQQSIAVAAFYARFTLPIAAQGTYDRVMERIVRNVRDIGAEHKQSLERLLGEKLRDEQRLLIQVFEAGEVPNLPVTNPRPSQSQSLSDWTAVYEGLSDDDIDAVNKIIKSRANQTRDLV